MAAELGRHGVSCRVVDVNDGPRKNARASVIQPRTLEIFDCLGIADRFVNAGVACADVVITTPDLKPLQSVSYDEIDSTFPFSLSIEQSRTERLLVGYLEELGEKWIGACPCKRAGRVLKKSPHPWLDFISGSRAPGRTVSLPDAAAHRKVPRHRLHKAGPC